MSKIKPLPSYLFFPLFMGSLVVLAYILQKEIWPQIIDWGIKPRKAEGLPGIFLGNFIHQDLMHLFNNVLAFMFASVSLYYFHRKWAWKIILQGIFITGLLTWITARPEIHIGMSGLNYVLISFMIITGILSKNKSLRAVSLSFIFMYGGLFWLMFPLIKHISWESHLSGFLTGLLLSYIYIPYIKEKYPEENYEFIDQEEDEFILCFDEHGNFIENNSTEEDFVKN